MEKNNLQCNCPYKYYIRPDTVNFIILGLLILIIILNIYSHYNHKYQITKLTNLFIDFTRFYIHTSSPPCRDLTNMDLLTHIQNKDSTKSLDSQEMKTNSTRTSSTKTDSIQTKVQVIDENNNSIKNFKSRVLKFTKPTSNQVQIVNPLSYGNYSKYLAVRTFEASKAPRRHSTVDLINRADIDLMPNEKLNEKSKFKFKQSESYSFELGNNIYANSTINHVKQKRDCLLKRPEVMPPRRPRLLGISDELAYGKVRSASVASYASTSTPNK